MPIRLVSAVSIFFCIMTTGGVKGSCMVGEYCGPLSLGTLVGMIPASDFVTVVPKHLI